MAQKALAASPLNTASTPATAAPTPRKAAASEPGDIQVINNYATLHARTDYIDHDDGRKRYLLRMWMNLPDSVQLSPDFAAFVRRGIPALKKAAAPGARPRIPPRRSAAPSARAPRGRPAHPYRR